MHFEWDERKNKLNIHKHGIDFVDAVRIFDNVTLTLPDKRGDYEDEYKEERWVVIGWVFSYICVLIYTERDDVTRIISVRKATKFEVREYEKRIKN